MALVVSPSPVAEVGAAEVVAAEVVAAWCGTATMTVGDPVVLWDPLAVARRGLSPVCPVVALDASAEVIGDPASGHIALGGALYTWA